MPCFSPLAAWQTARGDIKFGAEFPDSRALTLPCGQCVGCRLERSRQWAVRCMHEASLHDRNSFVTLTYNNDHVCSSLNYSDLQKFLKRLRNPAGFFPSFRSAWNDALIHLEAEAFASGAGTEAEATARRRERLRERRGGRFVACGEYGETFHRPHFHVLLFGKDFPDRTKWRKSSAGFQLYRSKELEKFWPFGHCEIGDVTFESAAYVARYNAKDGSTIRTEFGNCFADRTTGEIVQGADGKILFVEPEMFHMSTGKAIGLDWLRLFRRDVYRGDGDGFVVVNGMKTKPPRYYDNYIGETLEIDAVKALRGEKAMLRRDDQTPERLAVQEVVTRARLRFKKRSLE